MTLVENNRLSIPEGIAVLLRDLIHERTGIFFDPTRLDMMLDKLQEPARARNCHSLLDYYYLLKYDENGQGEWERVIDALSVQETYFWREMGQIRVLVDVLIPQWFKNHSEPLRIWSAACATGEEPYSIAIALQEAGWADRPIQIVASDASAAALAKARQGIFRERSFRSLPGHLREKYFEPVGQTWRISPPIAARVQFRRANIVARDEIQQFAATPFVFCRNVFIYFSPEAIRRALVGFARLMPARSHLFVGAAESLVKLTADFDLHEIQDSFAYVRRE